MGRLVLGVAATAAVTLAIWAPSSGARGDLTQTCPKGKLCVWAGASYTGDRLLIGTRDLSNRIYDLDGPDGPFNDEISSLKLRKPGTAVLYADTDGGAGRRCFGLDGEDRKVPDLASLDWQFDNVASSSKIPKSTHPNACDAA